MMGHGKIEIRYLRDRISDLLVSSNNDLSKNYWFKLDDIDLKKHTGKTFSPFIIFIQNGEQSNSFPIPKKISSDLPNNHLKYSLTWFSIAISILLIYLYFRKKNY